MATKSKRTNKTTDLSKTTTVSTPAPANRALTLDEVMTRPEGYTEPGYLAAMIEGFRSVASLPAKTRDERVVVRDAFLATMERLVPGVPVPTGKHTGRFSGQPVFESQNTLFLAAAMANVVLDEGHIMAAWRAELPNAKCDYLAKNYAWSTLSEYVNGRHNGSSIPGAVEVVVAWTKRGRKPLA